MIIKLLIDGGEMKPGPIVGQKLGPIGINIGQVIADVNKATAEFKGTKVPVSLDIDPKTKKFKIEVSSPPTSELLKKEASVESGSGDHKKKKVGNLSIETIIKVTKIKFSNMLAKEFKSAVKSVIGSAVSLGLLVESKGKEIMEDVEKGVYDSEIKSQKTETSSDKKIKLKAYFEKVLEAEEAAKKAEELAKAAEEAAKLAATAAAPGAAAATAAAGAKAEEGKTPTAAAPAAGKVAAATKKEEVKKK